MKTKMKSNTKMEFSDTYHFNCAIMVLEVFMNICGAATEVKQGSTLRVNLWPQASKNSPKQLRANKKIPQLVLQGQ